MRDTAEEQVKIHLIKAEKIAFKLEMLIIYIHF